MSQSLSINNAEFNGVISDARQLSRLLERLIRNYDNAKTSLNGVEQSNRNNISQAINDLERKNQDLQSKRERLDEFIRTVTEFREDTNNTERNVASRFSSENSAFPRQNSIGPVQNVVSSSGRGVVSIFNAFLDMGHNPGTGAFIGRPGSIPTTRPVNPRPINSPRPMNTPQETGDSPIYVGNNSRLLNASGERTDTPGSRSRASASFDFAIRSGDNGTDFGRAEGSVKVGAMSIDASASASLLSRENSFDVGDSLRVSTGAHVGRVHGKANIGVTSGQYVVKHDDITGELDKYFVHHGVSASAAVGYSSYSNYIKIRRGNESFGGEAGASSSILGANAKVGGRVEVTNKGVTAMAEAGAKAYVASGRVEGSINFFGLRIGGHVSGYAGGVGATAEVGFKDNKFKKSISGAAGFGFGAGISIGFDPEGWHEGVRNVRNVAGNTWRLFRGLFD